MIAFRGRMWRAVGVAALAGIGIAACAPEPPGGEGGAEVSRPSGEGGEAGGGEGGEGRGEGGEAGGGEGGEAGEAGARDVYAGIDGDARTLVRLQHLKGFLLLSDRLAREGDAAGAAILAQQALLEIADPALSAFAGVDLAPLRAAAAGADPATLAPALRATLAALDARQTALGGVDVETARRMLLLTRGLYAETITAAGVDPIEYQHSLGAALAAADALDEAQGRLRGPEAGRAKAAAAEMDKLLALFPAATAPETPAPVAAVLAQASRVELALPRV